MQEDLKINGRGLEEQKVYLNKNASLKKITENMKVSTLFTYRNKPMLRYAG